jgi:pSer/pThr/pTyr-binding forkhead associated (FHA) protein
MYELVYLGTCSPPRGTGRAFGGPLEPQFPKGTRFSLELGQRTVIGKVRDAGIFVDSMIVARHHGAVTVELVDGVAVLLIENLGGGMFTRGTYISDEARIGHGDLFELAGVLVFGFNADAES